MDKSIDIDALLDDVIALRCSNQFKDLMKRACEEELLNLINVGMDIEHAELKIPDEKMLPSLPQVQVSNPEQVDVVLKDLECTIKAIDFL